MKNVCNTIRELLQQNEVCIQIAKKVRPEIGKMLETYTMQGRITLYDCQKIDVVRCFKSAYDKFDMGFSITTHYKRKEIYDSKNKTWSQCNDGLNSYNYPLMKVVAREELSLEPVEVIHGMSKIFRAEILFLDKYSGPKPEDFKKILAQSLINVIYVNEIEKPEFLVNNSNTLIG
jgi:hypothetical protein